MESGSSRCDAILRALVPLRSRREDQMRRRVQRIQRIQIGVCSAVLITMLGMAPAKAEVVEGSPDVPPVSGAPMGRDAVRRGVQGPAGLFTARLQLLMNASSGSFGKPTSFAPDLYYSVTDNVQIGLVHSGPMGW